MSSSYDILVRGFKKLMSVKGTPQITVNKIIRLAGGNEEDLSVSRTISAVLVELNNSGYLKLVTRHGRRKAYIIRREITMDVLNNAFEKVMNNRIKRQIHKLG